MASPFFFLHSPRLLLLLMISLHLCSVLSDYCLNRQDCAADVCIRFPFSYIGHPPFCGMNVISCSEGMTWISLFNRTFPVKNISYTEQRVDIDCDMKQWCGMPPGFSIQEDKAFQDHFLNSNTTTVYKCKNPDMDHEDPLFVCEDGSFLTLHPDQCPDSSPDQCPEQYQIPRLPEPISDPSHATFSLHWKFDCDANSSNHLACSCEKGPSDCKGRQIEAEQKEHKNVVPYVILGVVPPLVIFVTCFILFLCFRKRNCKRQSHVAALFYSCSSSSRTLNQPNLESTSFYRRCRNVTIFTYEELEKATDGFSPSNELGDGGFGIVYYGVLNDSRKVAVKRLFEHSFNRVEQFMNEIEILSNIQHINLVRLYGCTTRNSRELLLVYEYVDNGTVGDHLNGSRVSERCLTWRLRLNIAVKAAEALAYLHQLKPPIIHRDVKTNNILLDKNFHVKVSDFGLSRLFPFDVTHVSTVPQGTPGYIDPQYHQCYQLTDKSDVYSFGVVLMELISSLPAVDITRPRDEVNLANMALNMIRNNALNEFVDSSLGFNTDYLVQKSVGAVAELAFSCLAYDMEVRPTMNEVAETLRQIQAQVQKSEKNKPAFQALLKSAVFFKAHLQSSPDPVDDKQVKQSISPNSIV